MSVAPPGYEWVVIAYFAFLLLLGAILEQFSSNSRAASDHFDTKFTILKCISRASLGQVSIKFRLILVALSRPFDCWLVTHLVVNLFVAVICTQVRFEMQIRHFSIQTLPFLTQNPSFLIQNPSFLLRNSSSAHSFCPSLTLQFPFCCCFLIWGEQRVSLRVRVYQRKGR